MGKYSNWFNDPRLKLTDLEVIEIFLSDEKLEYLAAVYNCSTGCISNIRCRKRRAFVTQHLVRPVPKMGRPFNKHKEDKE